MGGIKEVYHKLKATDNISRNSNDTISINQIDDGSNDVKFPVDIRYNDIWFTVGFLVQLLVFIVMTISSFVICGQHDDCYFRNGYYVIASILLGMSIIVMISMFLLWKKIFKMYPTQVITYSIYVMIGLGIPCVVILYYNRYWTLSTLFIITFIFLGLSYVKNREKIPHTVNVLLVTVQIIEKFPSMMVISFFSTFLLCVYWIIWVFTLVGFSYVNTFVVLKWLGYIFMCLNLYWVYFFISYSSFTILGGIVATWYYQSDVNFNGMPSHTISGSIKRSLTTSFGSVAFGALTTTIIQILISIFHCFVKILGVIPVFTLTLGLAFVRNVLHTFNIFTFGIVAIYGKSFLESSKKNMDIMNTQGGRIFSTMTYTDISIHATSFSIFFVVSIISIIIIAIFNAASTTYNYGYDSLFLVLIILWKSSDVLYSSVSTLVMCILSDPAVLEQTKPSLSYLLSI